MDSAGERIQDWSDIAAFLRSKPPVPPLFPADPQLRARAHFWEDWADESLYWFEIYLRFMYPEARDRSVALLAEGRPTYERTILGHVIKGMYGNKVAVQGLRRMPAQPLREELLPHVDALETLLATHRRLHGAAP